MTISNKDEVTSIEQKEGEGGGGNGVRLEVVKLERTLQERIVGLLEIGAEVGDPDKQ